eukprot:SAG22_NODE_3087_length_1952_cov_31.302752_4_plen_126_part_01
MGRLSAELGATASAPPLLLLSVLQLLLCTAADRAVGQAPVAGRPLPPAGASCPGLGGRGCAACIAHVDGRAGKLHGSPCVHLSAPEGGGRHKSDCMLASWWEAAKHGQPGVTCTGNATGCAEACGP